MSMLFSLSLKL
uniref:Uncharacterized protein n=1 Tax=Arundo donax TaxID=35708 RepID=A0A0A9C8J8_ARUDO